MIKIQIIKKENIIDSLEIKGHSGYDVKGSDIVCAGVSSVVTTSINGILSIDNEALKIINDDNPLEIKVLKHSDTTDKLLENMMNLLNDLQKQYPKNIKITEGEIRK